MLFIYFFHYCYCFNGIMLQSLIKEIVQTSEQSTHCMGSAILSFEERLSALQSLG